MVNQMLINATGGVAAMYGISNTAALYFMALLFSLFIGIYAYQKTQNGLAAVAGFFGSLFIFSLFDAFPLWILALPIVLIIFLAGRGNNA